MIGFTKSLFMEIAKFDIRANATPPGVVVDLSACRVAISAFISAGDDSVEAAVMSAPDFVSGLDAAERSFVSEQWGRTRYPEDCACWTRCAEPSTTWQPAAVLQQATLRRQDRGAG